MSNQEFLDKLRQFVKKTLVLPIIGRPIRKSMWLTIKFFEFMTTFLSQLYWKHPYVREIHRKSQVVKGEGHVAHFARNMRYLSGLRARIAVLPYQPKISVLIPMYKVNSRFFRECLQSVAQQVYENWEMCIVDDCSGREDLHNIVKEFQRKFGDKVKFAVNETNGHISVTSNHCLKLATGEYVSLLDHDDRFYPQALAEIVRYINWKNKPDILYSDEQVINEWGDMHGAPFHKPDWSPHLHLCMNYTTHLTTYNTALLREIGGFRKGYEGSQDHDVMLRMVEASKKPVVHIAQVLYQWRAHQDSTAYKIESKPYAALAGEKCVAEHIERRGRKATVKWEPDTFHYRVTYEVPTPPPLVSLIVATKDGFEFLNKCLSSIFEHTTYQNFEVVVVDNGTTDTRCLSLLKNYQADRPDRFKVINDPGSFNFARINNKGVAHASGQYIVLLNNDTEVVTGNWLQEMLSLAQHPESGAVGCKLLYPNNTVQHAGVALADRNIAVHLGLFSRSNDQMYCNMLNSIHEVAGITGACLMISKSKYLEVGGLDEVWAPNGYGDVEFCIKLMKKGYSNLYTPYAKLFHHESPSRGASIEYFEREYFVTTYGHELMNDPYQNPALTRHNHYEVNSIYHWGILDNSQMIYLLKTPQDQWSIDGFQNHIKEINQYTDDLPNALLDEDNPRLQKPSQDTARKQNQTLQHAVVN